MIIDEIELEYNGLTKDQYYETQSVTKGKQNYLCHFCGKSIKKGTPSNIHKFYPEFQGYRTHPKCSDKFMKSL